MSDISAKGNADFFCSECGKEVEGHLNICPYCGAVFSEDADIESGSGILKNESGFKKTDKRILGILAVIFIIALLAAVLIINDKEAEDENEFTTYIYSPIPGDIYEIKTDTDHFSLCKVIEVEGDTVYVSFHTDETETESGLEELKMNDSFETESYPFTISQLVEKYNDGYILNIERTTGETSDFTTNENEKDPDTVKAIKPDASVTPGRKANPAAGENR